MKQTVKHILIPLLVLAAIVCLSACRENAIDTEALWQNATYTEDTTLGQGANTVKVTIEAGDKSVVLTVKTDKTTLGEALFSHEIVNNPTFFDTANGIKADWDADSAYWAFYVGDDDTVAAFGIGSEQATTSGEPSYRLVYTK